MRLNIIKRKIRKFIFGYDVPTYFFSKSGEDAILFNIFYNKLASKTRGFYIDVGAHHHNFQSNTFLFYKNGWSGINIDADPDSIKNLRKFRKKDKNLNFGVGVKSGCMPFFVLKNGYKTMNSFSLDNLKKLGIADKIEKTIDIQVKPLSSLLEEYLQGKKEIDFMDVDVEGMDEEVLKSNDWNRFRPRIVLVESDSRNIPDILKSNIYLFMKSVEYELIAKTSFISELGTLIFENQE